LESQELWLVGCVSLSASRLCFTSHSVTHHTVLCIKAINVLPISRRVLLLSSFFFLIFIYKFFLFFIINIYSYIFGTPAGTTLPDATSRPSFLLHRLSPRTSWTPFMPAATKSSADGSESCIPGIWTECCSCSRTSNYSSSSTCCCTKAYQTMSLSSCRIENPCWITINSYQYYVCYLLSFLF